MIRRTYAMWLVLMAVLALPASAKETVEYIHTDALGSVVAVTDSKRNVIERREYEPYGAQTQPLPAVNGPGYTGHVFDAATGLVYMQQRYYDPIIGRFLSPDPMSVDTGTAWNFNRYNYANNNPYKFVDPDGRESGCIYADSCGNFSGVGSQAARGLGAAADGLDALDRNVLTPLGPHPVGLGGKAVVLPLVKVLKPIAAEAKALRMAENAAKGRAAEDAVAAGLGDAVAGRRVTLEASTGQRSVADIVTTDGGVIEVKSGGARLSPGQQAVQRILMQDGL